LLPKGGEESSHVAWYPAACLCQAQRGQHRWPLIDEEPDVALQCGKQERLFQVRESMRSIPLALQGQGNRTQHKDFQHTAQTCFGLGLSEQAL